MKLVHCYYRGKYSKFGHEIYFVFHKFYRNNITWKLNFTPLFKSLKRTLHKVAYFYLIFWCKLFVETYSSEIARNFDETVHLHKIFIPGYQSKLRYFEQWNVTFQYFLNKPDVPQMFYKITAVNKISKYAEDSCDGVFFNKVSGKVTGWQSYRQLT